MTEHSALERAHWALSRACNGWRRNKVCINRANSQPMDRPHPACLRAQEEHDQILRDASESTEH